MVGIHYIKILKKNEMKKIYEAVGLNSARFVFRHQGSVVTAHFVGGNKTLGRHARLVTENPIVQAAIDEVIRRQEERMRAEQEGGEDGGGKSGGLPSEKEEPRDRVDVDRVMVRRSGFQIMR